MCFSCICLFGFTCKFLSFFSSSWCRGLAAAYDCGTPWTLLLTFFEISDIETRCIICSKQRTTKSLIRLRGLICAFVVRILHKQVFS